MQEQVPQADTMLCGQDSRAAGELAEGSGGYQRLQVMKWYVEINLGGRAKKYNARNGQIRKCIGCSCIAR